jgi:transcription elongation GreA/GreB family factor
MLLRQLVCKRPVKGDPSRKRLNRCDDAFIFAAVKKQELMAMIIAQLLGELNTYAKAARAAHAEATHEQSKAESKYDTRGLEASYLARGQSRQAAELEQAIAKLRGLLLRVFGEGEPADIGAVIELHAGKERTSYFLLPGAGGTEVLCNGDEFLVITPESPLGKQIVGRKKGDRFQFEIAGTRSEYRVDNIR